MTGLLDHVTQALFGWRQRRRAARLLVEQDAAKLIEEHGDDAYYVARNRALALHRGELIDDSRNAEHWDKVYAEIARRTNRQHVDTATRYLEE